MSDDRSFQRWAAVALIVAFPLALGSLIVGLIGVGFDAQALSEPGALISLWVASASLGRWSMVLDMLGGYLLLTPAIILLWWWLEPKSPHWVRLCSLCGLAYVLVGATGAAMLAAIAPPLIEAYAQASGSQREMLGIVSETVVALVHGGLWNMLAVLVAGVWWVGIGVVLRSERRIFGLLTILLGLVALVDACASMVGIKTVSEVALYGFLLLAPTWAVWLGVDLLREPVSPGLSTLPGGIPKAAPTSRIRLGLRP